MVDFKSQECREEFSDWPHGLLAIGTFGIKDTTNHADTQQVVVEDDDRIQHETHDNDSMSLVEDFQDFTSEEIEKLQKELNKLLTQKPDLLKKEKNEDVVANFPLDRFLNCPSSLEIDRRLSTGGLASSTHDGSLDERYENDDGDDIERTISVILGKCKDIRAKKKEKNIGKKSISFLLKKMFVCSSGFAPQPSMKDTLGESRMEKLLRTLMHKKMSPQNSASFMNRYITHKQQQQEEETDEQSLQRSGDDEYSSKWVKTDSDCE
ncbi:Protein DEEPER ROOTING 1 [Linum perenne]